MVSVVFSSDFSKKQKITDFHTKFASNFCWDRAKSCRLVGEGNDTGYRIGELLKSFDAALKPEFYFTLQCWEIYGDRLLELAKKTFVSHSFDGLRHIGLD